MATAIKLDGGPLAGEQKVSETFKLTPMIGFPLDEELRPLKGGEPFAVAVYTITKSSTEPSYQFVGFQRPDGGPFPVRLIDGPAAGVLPAPQPAQFIEAQIRVPLIADGSPFQGSGEPTALAVYERREIEGKTVFAFCEIDCSDAARQEAIEEINEQKIQMAINNFYTNPNYDIYSIRPTGEHEQVPVEVGHRRGHVDVLIAPLITELWRLGMDTIGSCQERPRGSSSAGRAYIGFIRLREAKFFLELLTNNGIAAEGQDRKFNIARKDGPNEEIQETLSFDTMNVLFETADIERATQLMQGVESR